MDPQQVNSLEFLLRHSAVYGLAFVFLAGVLALLLWVAWSTVSILKTWLPQWFQSQIKSQKQVGIGINRLSKFILMLYRKHNGLHEATGHLVTAMDVFFTKNKDRYNVPSSTLHHIQSAKEALMREDDVGNLFDSYSEDETETPESDTEIDLSLTPPDQNGGDSNVE